MTKDANIQSKLCAQLRNCVYLVAFFIAVLMIMPTNSYACGDDYCCASREQPDTRDLISDEHDETRDHITDDFDKLIEWLKEVVWLEYILPGWMHMTEQITVTATHQVLIIGTFFDAKQQMEVQMAIQKLNAEAHRDYQPDAEICVIGTAVRSLAQSERIAEINAFVMSQKSMDRQMANRDTSAAYGNFANKTDRIINFKKRFCDKSDNGPQGSGDDTGLKPMCKETTEAVYKNRDIDYTQTIARHSTLDVNFTDSSETKDEYSINALADNLYAHDVTFRLPETVFYNRDNRDEVLDFRMLIAKRSVIEMPLQYIVGTKSRSGGDIKDKTSPYLKRLLMTLEIPDDDIKYYMGELTSDGEKDPEPSYDMQMKILTKLAFQSPDFYTNLYANPENVERKAVALQAIELMQNFDIWKSHLRTEAMLSVMLEMEIERLQKKVQNTLNQL